MHHLVEINMLFENGNLACNMLEIISHSKIKRTFVCGVSIGNWLPLFSIKRVNDVDLENDCHIRVVSSKSDFFDNS